MENYLVYVFYNSPNHQLQNMTFPTHLLCNPAGNSRPEWRPSSPWCCQLHMPFVHPPWHPLQQSSYSPATFNEDVDSFQQAPLSQGYRCSLWNPVHHVGEQISGKSGRFFSGLHVGMANIDKLKTTSCMTEPSLFFQHLKLDYFFQRVEKLYYCHEFIFTKD